MRAVRPGSVGRRMASYTVACKPYVRRGDVMRLGIFGL